MYLAKLSLYSPSADDRSRRAKENMRKMLENVRGQFTNILFYRLQNCEAKREVYTCVLYSCVAM